PAQAVASRPRRSGARQSDGALQAGVVVLELELAAVQSCDGGGEAQTQSRAWLRPALFEPHEALDDTVAIGVGNTRPVVRHRERNAIAVHAGFDYDLGGHFVGLGGLWPGIFDRVIDEIRQRL